MVDTTTVAESSCLSAPGCPGQDSNPRGITPNGFLSPEHWPNWPAYQSNTKPKEMAACSLIPPSVLSGEHWGKNSSDCAPGRRNEGHL